MDHRSSPEKARLWLRKQKKVFLDCGGHKGESAVQAWKLYGEDCAVISFEPNRELNSHYDAFVNANHLLFHDGVSDRVERKAFHYNGGTSAFTSYMSMIGNMDNIQRSRMINCIDLCQFIEEWLLPEQEIYLKLDVEGAEYRILAKLLRKNIIQVYINELFLDFHAHRMVDELVNDPDHAQSLGHDPAKYYLAKMGVNNYIVSMHNQTIIQLLLANANISHWDAIGQFDGQATYHKDPVYYLGWDMENYRWKRFPAILHEELNFDDYPSWIEPSFEALQGLYAYRQKRDAQALKENDEVVKEIERLQTLKEWENDYGN